MRELSFTHHFFSVFVAEKPTRFGKGSRVKFTGFVLGGRTGTIEEVLNPRSSYFDYKVRMDDDGSLLKVYHSQLNPA